MAEDDVVRFDPQPTHHLCHRPQAGATELAVEPPGRDRRERRDARHRADRREGADPHPPHRSVRDTQLQRRHRMDRVAQRIDRQPSRPLVVIRPQRPVRQRREPPTGERARDRRDEVAVDVVAVRRPHPAREPCARIAHDHSGRPQRLNHEREQRPAVARHRLGRPDRPALPPPRADPAADERRVVVARHEHDPARRRGGADRLEHRPRSSQRAQPRRLIELDGVSQEDQAVGLTHHRKKRVERRPAVQHVVPRPHPEVKVGDDERAHRARVSLLGEGLRRPRRRPSARRTRGRRAPAGPCG